jgi:RNA polymerase sigma-70 factor (ECF subfamily)
VKKIEELYQLYFKDIYLFVKALSKDEHIAEEITQETFFKAMKSIASFKGECDIRVWLCQIAKNTYYSYCKKNNRIISEEEPESVDTEQKSIESQLIDKEDAVAIHKILHKLEEPYKEVFHLRTFGELSFKEIGEVFEKTESWSRVTYHRAKMKIIEQLNNK